MTKRRAMMIIMGLGAVTTVAWLSRVPVNRPQVAVGETISRPGEFQLSDSQAHLKFAVLPSGDLDLTIQQPAESLLSFLGVEPEYSATHSIMVPADSDWFAAVDQHGGLWVCSMPKPDPVLDAVGPCVMVDGLRLPSDGRPIRCVESVIDSGDWRGVPDSFLQRLRREQPSVALPATAVGYTAEQSAILRRAH